MTIDEAKIKIGELACYARTKGWDDEYTEAVNMIIKALEQQPTDAISRQAVIDTIDKWVKNMHVLIALPANEVTPLFESVHELPPVILQQKMGRWIKNAEEWQNVDPPYICSECGRASLRQENFCCSCGAKMQEVEE